MPIVTTDDLTKIILHGKNMLALKNNTTNRIETVRKLWCRLLEGFIEIDHCFTWCDFGKKSIVVVKTKT